MIKWILRKMGYIKFDWGHACGRYYLELDGHEFYQGSLEHAIPEENVRKIVFTLRGY